jgi:hypothetical protein
VFQGTRIPVAALFENLEDGVSLAEFVQLFPGVTEKQARLVLDHVARTHGSVLPSHTRVSSSSATPGWAAIQSRSRVSYPVTSSWASSSRNVESDGDLPKSVPNSSLSVWRWRLA